jgi:hypothetical protein
MRTSFELKVAAETLEEAKTLAMGKIALFLEIPIEEVLDQVTLEIKVSYPKAETISEVEEAQKADIFVVTAFGSLKQGLVKPFGNK